MDPLVVVIADLPVNGLDELSDVVKSFRIAQFKLKIAVERFLEAILPRAPFPAVRRDRSALFKQGFIGAGDVFAALI